MHTIVRPDQITLLVAFAHHVRSGGVSTRSREVRAQTVQVALRSIGTKFFLDGEPSPLGPPKGGYPKALQQLLEGYRREDPVSQPKLAIPLTVPRYLHLQGNTFGSEKEKAIGDFALIAFYYLLRVGKYTYHRPSDRRRTQQFRAHDVAFLARYHTTASRTAAGAPPESMHICNAKHFQSENWQTQPKHSPRSNQRRHLPGQSADPSHQTHTCTHLQT